MAHRTVLPADAHYRTKNSRAGGAPARKVSASYLNAVPAPGTPFHMAQSFEPACMVDQAAVSVRGVSSS